MRGRKRPWNVFGYVDNFSMVSLSLFVLAVSSRLLQSGRYCAPSSSPWIRICLCLDFIYQNSWRLHPRAGTEYLCDWNRETAEKSSMGKIVCHGDEVIQLQEKLVQTLGTNHNPQCKIFKWRIRLMLQWIVPAVFRNLALVHHCSETLALDFRVCSFYPPSSVIVIVRL